MSEENQITTQAPKAEIAITDPEIMRERAAFGMLQRQAQLFADSTLVPKDFQGNIANCAIGINIAKRLQADPFMVIQNIDIIHGRPSFRATFLIAMVNAAGRFAPLQFRMTGEQGKADRGCIAWTKSKDDGAILEGPEITMAMAKAEGWSTKNGSKWLTMPELMLRYRAAAFFARLYAPDVTLGMQTAEEAIDLGDVTERRIEPPRQPLSFATEEKPPIEAQDIDSTALDDFIMFINAKDMAAGAALERICTMTRTKYAALKDVPDSVLQDVMNDWEAFAK